MAGKYRNSTSSSQLIDAKLEEYRIKRCPACGHQIEREEALQDWPGLPSGVKFDPTDQELIEHLQGKISFDNSTPHPLIDEFIPTIEGGDGICYTHPEKLPGISRDGLVRHFFHRPSKAYTTGTRKRRKIQTPCDETSEGETRWHKTGKTRPVLVNGMQKGCKKILVLYTNFGKHRKPEKTNWVMHQYHLGSQEEEKEGELVVSKVFYQTQPRQCNWEKATDAGDTCKAGITEATQVPERFTAGENVSSTDRHIYSACDPLEQQAKVTHSSHNLSLAQSRSESSDQGIDSKSPESTHCTPSSGDGIVDLHLNKDTHFVKPCDHCNNIITREDRTACGSQEEPRDHLPNLHESHLTNLLFCHETLQTGAVNSNAKFQRYGSLDLEDLAAELGLPLDQKTNSEIFADTASVTKEVQEALSNSQEADWLQYFG